MLFNRIGRRVRWSMTAASALVLTTLGAPALAATDSVAQSTVVGIHNAYTKADFPYLAKALDAGASMVELDAWDDIFTREWKVSHAKPTSNDNNYIDATNPTDIYSGSANKDSDRASTTSSTGSPRTPRRAPSSSRWGGGPAGR